MAQEFCPSVFPTEENYRFLWITDTNCRPIFKSNRLYIRVEGRVGKADEVAEEGRPIAEEEIEGNQANET